MRYFPEKKGYFFLRRSDSVKNILLNGEIIIGHCNGYDTIILIILIDGFKEKSIRLYDKEVCW